MGHDLRFFFLLLLLLLLVVPLSVPDDVGRSSARGLGESLFYGKLIYAHSFAYQSELGFKLCRFGRIFYLDLIEGCAEGNNFFLLLVIPVLKFKVDSRFFFDKVYRLIGRRCKDILFTVSSYATANIQLKSL